jgi:hypothetical protein
MSGAPSQGKQLGSGKPEQGSAIPRRFQRAQDIIDSEGEFAGPGSDDDIPFDEAF